MFPLLKPSPEQQARYQELAQRLLNTTIREYERHHSRPPHHRMPSHRWKAVKTRENLSVYKERDPLPIEHCDVGKDWKDPKLLVATGSIVGQLDDVMYGVVTPDAESMLLKAAITKNRLVGGAVLHQIQGPTIHEPFRFLGVKWFVMAPPTTLNGMIWSRDVVFVESTGITTLPNGDRIGYQLMQSVDIPGYGHLEQHSIVRGRLSSCSIFKQLANGTVDVYVRGYVEAFGKVMDSVALKTAASGFLSSWNSVGCAQYKKLMWCVQRRGRRGNTTASCTPVNRDRLSCGACARKFRAFHSADMCILCDLMMCSRCRVQWKLREVDPRDLRLSEKDVVICKSCVASASKHDPVEIAKQEIRSGRFEVPANAKPVIKLWTFKGRRNARVEDVNLRATHDTNDHTELRSLDAAQPKGNASSSASNSSLVTTESKPASTLSRVSSFAPSSSEVEELDLDHYSCTHHASAGSDDDRDEEEEVCVRVGEVVPYPPPPAAPTPFQYQQLQLQRYQGQSEASNAKAQLWQQIRALQVATESTYQLTLHTADVHLKNRPMSK